MENVFQNISEILADGINNYSQKLVLLQYTNNKSEELAKSMNESFSSFMQNKIAAYKEHNKWKDLEKFFIENQEAIQSFQNEFDNLVQEIHSWKKINIRGFTQKWNDESKRIDPFSE